MLLDAVEIAGEAGPRGINAGLLGAATVAPGFPIGAGALEAEIRRSFGSSAGPVLEAFRRGRRAAAVERGKMGRARAGGGGGRA